MMFLSTACRTTTRALCVRLASAMAMHTDLRTEILFENSGWRPDSDIVNLNMGAPGPDTLTRCVTFFEKATEQRLHTEHKQGNLFQYGPEIGNWDYRDQLSKFLEVEYQNEVRRQSLILTCGATHGLWLAASVLVPPGTVVFVEDPTYYVALTILSQDLQMKIVPVPVLKDGMDVNVLEKLIAEERETSNWKPTDKKPFRGMIYTIPTFHNPTGICYTEACCRKLIQVAQKNDLLVLCDDVYNLLYYKYNGDPPSRLIVYDDPCDPDYKGHVISNGTFSKIMGPGIRVGWIETAPRLINILQNSGILSSSGSVNNYTAGILATVMELGYQTKHLQYLREEYTERMTASCSTLELSLPPGCSFYKPKGGYFIWITLPLEFDSATFIPWCRTKYKVNVIDGVQFTSSKKFHNCIRLSISYYQKDRLVAAVSRLCDAVKEFLGENGPQDSIN